MWVPPQSKGGACIILLNVCGGFEPCLAQGDSIIGWQVLSVNLRLLMDTPLILIAPPDCTLRWPALAREEGRGFRKPCLQ